MDEDDYGLIVPLDDFKWNIIQAHTYGSCYGFRGWCEHFVDLMIKHPIFVDPVDTLEGHLMFFFNRMKNSDSNSDYDYSHFKPNIKKYNIILGIGRNAHFAPDFEIGVKLGWGDY